ncbi:hypothetical protein [Flavobacterium pallidum]|uniref:Uncharacterized protein n=1 Tax=Flavobacterium pallidum TaxID=2172098 RepID=A0A2S1SK64_9FLAO|nr:hypothetical protein [Flavobacterium pallidum]AWI26814.1 hypothetical protein HYN49_13405 [Flavobacterium pallidum]
MPLTATVNIPDGKEHYIENLKNLAIKHGIEYVNPKVTENSTIFNFILKDGEEDKKKAFLNEVPADWL